MTNVVQIKQRQTVVGQGNLSDQDNDFTKQVRALINARVRDAVFGGEGKLTMKRLSLKAGLSHATVSKLAYYETTRPAWRTVIAVAEALDIMADVGQLMINYARKNHK